MRTVRALTHHNPTYLKATYADPYCKLYDHVRHMPTGIKFIAWDNGFAVFHVEHDRTTRHVGTYESYFLAAFMCTT